MSQQLPVIMGVWNCSFIFFLPQFKDVQMYRQNQGTPLSSPPTADPRFKIVIYCNQLVNRGYNMAAQSYEISLRVLKNHASPSGHVIYYLLCNTNEI